MASKMFLYWGSGSIPCWKAMIALQEKNLSGYASKLIEFSKEEQKSPEVLALNPRGEVPTFKDDNVVVNESGAIVEYLEAKFPNQGTKLFPDNIEQRAVVLQRMYEASNLFKQFVEEVIYYIFSTKPEDIDKNLLAKKKETAKKEVDLWEEILKKSGGTYLAGAEFSMADVHFFPTLAFGVRTGLDLSDRPTLNNYHEFLCERKSIKATWPPHWKGSEGDKTISSGV